MIIAACVLGGAILIAAIIIAASFGRLDIGDFFSGIFWIVGGGGALVSGILFGETITVIVSCAILLFGLYLVENAFKKKKNDNDESNH